MGDEQQGDLPAWLVSLARQLARDCGSPGRYQIEFSVPHYPGEDVDVLIAKLEIVRKYRSKRKG